MRLFTLFIAVLTLFTGEVQALDYYRTLELLGIEYHVGKSPNVEGIGRTRAVYHSGRDDIIIAPKGIFEFKSTHLHTVLHELAHWAGARKERAPRELDVYMEEVVAETVASMLSEVLYKGKYHFDMDGVEDYLRRHPQHRELEDKELAICLMAAYETTNFLLEELKKVDEKNELQIQ